MKKIPTLFVRDPDDMRRVLPEVHPDCQWVLDGEGVATRKYDGTCVSWHDGDWWFRREVKPGKNPPDGWAQVALDETTGKRVGWEPARPTSGFIRLLREAIDNTFAFGDEIPEGTYELCGPKVNGNPEHFGEHRLIRHADAEVFNLPARLDFNTCRRAVLDLAEYGHEGIVWHHPDGRMAKLKACDFR